MKTSLNEWNYTLRRYLFTQKKARTERVKGKRTPIPTRRNACLKFRPSSSYASSHYVLLQTKTQWQNSAGSTDSPLAYRSDAVNYMFCSRLHVLTVLLRYTYCFLPVLFYGWRNWDVNVKIHGVKSTGLWTEYRLLNNFFTLFAYLYLTFLGFLSQMKRYPLPPITFDIGITNVHFLYYYHLYFIKYFCYK